METKVVHVHFLTNQSTNIQDWYFGSLKAIFDRFDRDEMGITYRSLTNAMRGQTTYKNKMVEIDIGKLQRKPNKHIT